MQITSPEQLSSLTDKCQGFIDPHMLADFKFGNQRGARKSFDNLVASIRSHKGVNTPLIVRRCETDESKLEVVAGHGRRDGAIEVGLSLVPFCFREVDDQTAFDIHMSDNLDREGLDIIAKVHAFTRYLTQFRGDYEATASRLNMDEKKLRRFLELNKCSEAVKDAIREEKLSPSHGLVLAPFPHPIQERNLERMIEEKWTVKELKERTGKVKLPLSQAKFDTTACQTCEHNTYPQMDLLIGMDEEAKCANVKCFQAKTTEHVASKKESLSERYGTIILLSETSEDNRETVGAEVVGEAQYDNCQNCQNHVTVLDDRIGHEESIIESQCVDRVCFTKCQTAHRVAIDEARKADVANNSSNGKKEGDAAVTGSKGTAKTTRVATKEATLTPSMTNAYNEFATHEGLAYFKDQPEFIHAMVTGALIAITRHKRMGFDEAVATALSMSADERNALSVKIVTEELTEKSMLMDSTMTELIKKCLVAKADESIPMLTKAWKPTKERLSIYTIKQLGQLGKDAGFDQTLNTEKQGSFAKLLKGGKGAIIDALCSSVHNFEAFIPKSLLNHLFPNAVLSRGKKPRKSEKSEKKDEGGYMSVPVTKTKTVNKETEHA